jgi:hypothetical protein
MTTQHLYHTPVTKSKKVFTHQNTANKEYGIHSVLFGITVILFIWLNWTIGPLTYLLVSYWSLN